MKAQRWRITFAKTEAMRYTSHLDLILTWERTFRRSGLPLSYSEGFNPRPVINLAAPLPLGFISEGEIGDFWLSEITPFMQFSQALNEALPPGLRINTIGEQPEIHGAKLPSLVLSAEYRIEMKGSYPELNSRIDDLLGSASLVRQRKGKTYDLRPLIQRLELQGRSTPDRLILDTTLSLLPGATGRPDEVLAALELPTQNASICRERIHLKDELES